jgi:hypothetical protein
MARETIDRMDDLLDHQVCVFDGMPSQVVPYRLKIFERLRRPERTMNSPRVGIWEKAGVTRQAALGIAIRI